MESSMKALPRGLTFFPDANELTDLYLRRKIVGEDLPVHFIHDADVYSAEPEKLVERFSKAPGTGDGNVQKQPVWYFFSTVRYAGGGRKRNARGGPGRKSRAIVGDAGRKHSWHSKYRERPVKGGSSFGGYQQKFSYMVKNPSSGKDERAGWIMTEYGISPEHGGGDLVLCEIHPSPRTSTDDEMPDPVNSSKKRKVAAEDEDPRASARPRHMADQDEHRLLAQPEPAEPEEPDTPRPQTPRRQEPGQQLQAIQGGMMMPAGVVDDEDPAGNILEVDEDLGHTLEELLADDGFMDFVASIACPAPEPACDNLLRSSNYAAATYVMPSSTSVPMFWGM